MEEGSCRSKNILVRENIKCKDLVARLGQCSRSTESKREGEDEIGEYAWADHVGP